MKEKFEYFRQYYSDEISLMGHQLLFHPLAASNLN